MAVHRIALRFLIGGRNGREKDRKKERSRNRHTRKKEMKRGKGQTAIYIMFKLPLTMFISHVDTCMHVEHHTLVRFSYQTLVPSRGPVSDLNFRDIETVCTAKQYM